MDPRGKIPMQIPLLALILVLFLARAPVAAEPADGPKTVVLAGAVDYPPYIDSQAPGFGLAPQILNKVLEGSPWTLRFELMPPARIINDMKAGHLQVSAYTSQELSSSPGISELRLLRSRLLFFYNNTRPRPRYEKLSDLAGLSVGLTMSQTNTGSVKQVLLQAGLVPVEVSTLRQSFLMLQYKRVDLVFCLEETARALANEAGMGSADWSPLPRAFAEIVSGPVFVTSSSQGQALYELARKGLERIRKDGTLLNLLEKHYGKGKVPLEEWFF